MLLLHLQLPFFPRRVFVVGGAVLHVPVVGNGPDGGARHDEAYDPHDPVRPRPRRVFRQQGGKGRPEDVPARRTCPEETEDHVLAHPVGIRRPQQGQPVGRQKSRAHPLEAPGDGEEDVVGIVARPAQDRPYPIPGEGGHEHALVPVHVAQTAGDEDKGAGRQAEGGDVPTQLAGDLDVEVVAYYMERGQSLTDTGLGE